MTTTYAIVTSSRLAALIPLALYFLSSFSTSVVGATSFEMRAPVAFVSVRSAASPFPSSRRQLRTAANEQKNANGGIVVTEDDDDDDRGCHFGIGRRELIRSTAIVAGTASLVSPSKSARAAAAVATDAVAETSAPASNTLCDPSVSTWVKNYDGSPARTVHILGTAHISSSSAETAGRMVKELKPDVVFLELDAKRVARAIPGGVERGGGGGSAPSGTNAASDGSARASGDATRSGSVAVTSTPDTAGSSEKTASSKSNPFDMRSRMVNVGSKYVGDAVKGMYGKLESEGFKAGDEFAASAREGLAIGSTIVLGDRDVEVTLRRLTAALARTDLRKLLATDSEVNSSMEELLPEGMKEKLKQQSSQSTTNGGGGLSNNMSVPTVGMEDIAIDKGEFQTFVETMKAKENVKKIMRGLQSTAPEIYEAMVAERDVYMGRGLDELGLTLKDKSANDTVAVMGMAHVDGVERYLASKGWKEIRYPCPAAR